MTEQQKARLAELFAKGASRTAEEAAEYEGLVKLSLVNPPPVTPPVPKTVEQRLAELESAVAKAKTPWWKTALVFVAGVAVGLGGAVIYNEMAADETEASK